MDRVDTAGHVGNRWADDVAGVETVLGQKWHNGVQEELVGGVIEDGGGLTPIHYDALDEPGTARQVVQAIRLMIGRHQGWKSLMINGYFQFWQRGLDQTLSAEAKYVADRFFCDTGTAGVAQIQRLSHTFGDETMRARGKNYLSWDQTTPGTTNPSLEQRVSHMHRINDDTVTLQFACRTPDASFQLTPRCVVYFGSTGSSPIVLDGSPITVGSSWEQQSVTFVIPSINGLSTGGSQPYISFGLILPTTIFHLHLDQYQVVRGPEGLDFDFREEALELTLCRTRYQQSYDTNVAPGSTGRGGAVFAEESDADNIVHGLQRVLGMTMQGAPTITWYSPDTGAVDNIHWDGVDKAVAGTLYSNRNSTGVPQVSSAPAGGGLAEAQWTAEYEVY